MSEIKEKREVSFTDYLSILLKWKKILIINLFLVIIGATIYSFMIPKTYKSTTTLMIPGEKEMGLGSLLGGGSALSLGAQLLGGSSATEDMILGILNSRLVLSNVADRFDLYTYYDIEDHNYDLLMQSFSDDIIFTPNEFGLIEIQAIHKDAQKAADMANYFSRLADSINIELNIEQASNNRIFVEKRFLKIEEDIAKAEEEYYQFQKQNAAYDIPEQLKVSVQAAAELETELFKKEILLNSIEKKVSSSSPLYKDLEYQIAAIKEKLEELNSNSEKGSIFVSFSKIPDLQLKYIRLYREIEIQNKILEFIYPMYEQAKIDEKKSTPTLIVVDKAVPAQLKFAPKKAFIILGIFFIALFIHIIVIYLGDKAYNRKEFSNIIEKKETEIFTKLLKFYNIKFK